METQKEGLFVTDMTSIHDRYSASYEPIKDHFLEEERTKLNILDVGCSAGLAVKDLATYLSQNGFAPYTIGIEGQPCDDTYDNLDKVHEIIIGHNQPIPCEDNSADVVICNKMFWSVSPDLERETLTDLARVVKPNGLFYGDLRYKATERDLHDINCSADWEIWSTSKGQHHFTYGLFSLIPGINLKEFTKNNKDFLEFKDLREFVIYGLEECDYSDN